MITDARTAIRVTLIRHGLAGDGAPSDEERALTAKGRQATRRVARALDGRDIRFDCIVSSPLVRAVQTAEIIAAGTHFRGAILVHRALAPDAPPAGVVALLRDLAPARRVALVAHEPILSSLGGLLVGQGRLPPLAKSEALRVRLPDGPGKPGAIRWHIDPDGRMHRKGGG